MTARKSGNAPRSQSGEATPAATGIGEIGTVEAVTPGRMPATERTTKTPVSRDETAPHPRDETGDENEGPKTLASPTRTLQRQAPHG